MLTLTSTLTLITINADEQIDIINQGQVCWEHYCAQESVCVYDDEHFLETDPSGGVWVRCKEGIMGHKP
jgi:hypothetical protein